jgi:hypothetical protein
MKMVLMALAWAAFAVNARADDSTTSVLNLDYNKFDQTQHSGWRALSEEGHLRESAVLIEAYLAKHTKLNDSQKVALHFHAAQALALAGDNAAALKHLTSARQKTDYPGYPDIQRAMEGWNDYVSATEAFLQHDLRKLQNARERLAKNSALASDKMFKENLKIVDALVAHFNDSYKKAYTGE